MARSLLFALALAVYGCDDPRSVGSPCDGDDACESGLCAGGVAGDSPVCTKSCRSGDECPDGWSCSGVTQNKVLVCTKGAATPFGGR
jgi:hypothetical protein